MDKFYWLNEDSRLTLERGYLNEGETPEGRIQDIADTAENILGIEGFSDKFYDYMSRGFYSLSSPVWSNFGKRRGFSISCVTGDTWVNTNKGGKKAKDIEVGDLVLTHKNRFKPVTKVMPTKDRDDIWKLKVGSRMTNLYITGDHVVLTNTGWKRVDELDFNKDLIAVNGELEYQEQKYVIDMKKYAPYDFEVEDGLIKARVVNKEDRKEAVKENYFHSSYAQIPEYVEVDEELAWAIGVWFADGSLSKNNKREPNGIRMTCGLNKKETIVKEWSRIISDKFNINCNTYESNTDKSSWLSTNANSSLVGKFFESFGNGSKEKHLNEELLNLPKKELNSLLKGIFQDGTHYEETDNYKLTLSNPELLLQVYNIGLKLGKEMSLQMQEKGGKLSSTRYVYTVLFRGYTNSVSRNNVKSGVKFSDGLTYCPINVLERTEKVEDVYDFTVEEDHSFSVAGVVVHNCFGSYIEDNVASLLNTASEVGMMSKHGGGTSGYFGNVRPRGAAITNNGESSGAVHFMELFEQVTDTISQGNTRRGKFTPYLPLEHDDIHEFLEIGTEGNAIQSMTTAVSVTDEWMIDMLNGDKDKRDIWAKVLARRTQMGYPYIFFKDNANERTVDVYKALGYEINNSNLCSEIMLPNNDKWSFVCNLSSMNLERFDDWKDTDAVETMVYFLDAVMTEFISDLERMRDSEDREERESFVHMERAYNFAKANRALGLGALGWHSYLQSKMIPFESVEANKLNARIFALIQRRSYKASEELAEMFGEPEVLKGYGRRNATLNAIAPTTSSSFILGQVSKSIEPFMSNYFVVDTAKVKKTMINEHLMNLLKEKGKYTREIIEDIRDRDGSVQHLDFLTEREKEVFKTYGEINQYNIIDQAATRQHFIDQGQSLNIMVNASDITASQLNELHLFAWSQGIKSLYYQHGTNASQQFNLSKLCLNCEA